MKDMPMTPEEHQDAFETWLASMDVYLDELKAAFPDPSVLDYSVESLKPLEAWLLERYPTVAAAKAEKTGLVNGAGCYVGEVLRKAAGRGTWKLDANEKSVFFGYPLLVDFAPNDKTAPQTLVTAATDRRKGDYIFTVVTNLLAKGQ